MEEKRDSSRTDLALYLEVLNSNDNSIIGRIGDISANGFMILSEKKLPLNMNLEVIIKVPDNIDFIRKKIDLTVVTKWEKPDFNPEYFCIGCEYLKVDDQNVLLIKKLIQTYGYNLITE